MKKKNFPVSEVRRFMEPGPVVLVSSAWKGKSNVMTMGWHMMLSEEPSLIGCFIWDQDHSFKMIRKSKECVINLPTVDIAKIVVKIGNTSGRDIDKFAKFKLTASPAAKEGRQEGGATTTERIPSTAIRAAAEPSPP